MTTAPTSREIRVFLSSTFQDMDAERNHLLKQVFPQVRAACLARQVGFTEIDLRWGVTEEESKNGATVEICLKEIDRCRDFPPFFIGFLGERYGWIPRHEDLTAYWERHGESPYAAPIQAAVQRGISVTELEMELAVLATGAADKLAGHALFLLRDPALTDQLYQQATGRDPDPSDRRFYDPADGQLATLRDRIRHSGFLGVDGYPSVEVFGQVIADYLLAQLDHYFPADEIPSAFEQSNLAHATFRYHRLQNFLPRPEVRQAVVAVLAQRVDQPHLGPILLTGPSGQGKSALMADLARHLETAQGEVHWRVIDHYVGADGQNSLTAWLDRVLETLHPEIQDLTGPIPETLKDRREALSSWLAMAARRTEQRGADQRPVRFVLVLDALDQLSDGGKDLEILKPEIIGPDAVLISSAAEGTPAREAARSFAVIEVPVLTAALRTGIINASLKRYRKGLASQLVDTLAQARQSGSPLFLTLALEELRLDARHATLASTIEDILAQPDAERLFLQAFLLDPDNNRPEQPDLAVRFMALLGASRAGLTEHELADLLALPGDPVPKEAPSAEEGKPRLPQVHLSRLLANFQPFLLNKDGRRAPMHRIFGVAALAHAGQAAIREQLYTYFQPGYGSDWDSVDERGAAEALYQIIQLAGLEGEAEWGYRERLVRDLGYLRVPTYLYEAANTVTAEGLLALTEDDKTELGNRWEQIIWTFDLAGMTHASEDILGFAGWMEDMAFDQYHLPRRLLEALLAVQENMPGIDGLILAGTMSLLGILCHNMADYSHMRLLHERALAIREKVLGPTHPDTAKSLHNLASYLANTSATSDRAAARPIFERVLAIREKALGPTHPDIALTLNNLAVFLRKTGNPADFALARQYHERALAIREQVLGPMHQETSQSLNNLAYYLNQTGDPNDLKAARPLFERALAINEEVLGPSHPKTAKSLNNLAGYLGKTGYPADFEAARALFERAMAISEKALGPTHPETATTLANLGGYLGMTGNSDDSAAARPLLERALQIHEQVLGPMHPDLILPLDNLAKCLTATGDPSDYAMARPLFKRALAISEASLGQMHPNTALCLTSLAYYFVVAKDPDALASARSLYEGALAIREQALGPAHPETAKSLNNLALYLEGTGDPADRAAARPLYERALAIREQTQGLNHPDTATSLHNLADYLEGTGKSADFAAARPLYERALAIREQVLGPTHLDTAKSLNKLAFYLERTGNPADSAAARPLYEGALAIREQVLGPTHLDTAKSLNNLAVHLVETGEPADSAARPLFERALAIREQALGLLHPDTATSIINLADYLVATNEPTDQVTACSLYERVLPILGDTLGLDIKLTLRVKQNFATALHRAGRSDNALPMIRDVVEGQIQLTGDNSLDTASALMVLAVISDESGDRIGAEDAFRRALAILTENLGPNDHGTQLVESCIDGLKPQLNTERIMPQDDQ